MKCCVAWVSRLPCRSSKRWCRRGPPVRRAPRKIRFAAIEMVHGAAGSTKIGIEKNMWSPAATGRAFDLTPDQPEPARSLPRPPDHHQQHRRAQCRGLRGTRNWRRSFPLERGVPDTDAPAPDARVGCACRHLARSVLRAEVRPGYGDPLACSCASRTWIRPAAAPTVTPASTPIPSAGPRPTDPLPMVRDPRSVFDMLFGVGATPQDRA